MANPVAEEVNENAQIIIAVEVDGYNQDDEDITHIHDQLVSLVESAMAIGAMDSVVTSHLNLEGGDNDEGGEEEEESEDE